MDREAVIRHFKMSEKHVAEGERHIARQRQIIDDLVKAGRDTRMAIELLRLFEQTQANHVADLYRAHSELLQAD